MRLSIIIPVYNAERWLTELVESLNRQTCQDFEVVFVNDGSSDNSQEILNELCRKDARFHVFRQRNQGVSVARNIGLVHIRGDYFTFVDSDDVLNDHTVEDWNWTVVENNLDCLVEQDLTRFSSQIPLEASLPVDGMLSVYGQPEAKRRFLTGSWKGFVAGKIYRTSCFRYLRFYSEISLWEDLLFFIQALEKGARWGFSTGSHYFYRQMNTSLSHRGVTETTMSNVLEVSRQALEAMAEVGISTQEMQRAWSANFLCFYHHVLPQIYAKSSGHMRHHMDECLQHVAMLLQMPPMGKTETFFMSCLYGHGYLTWLRMGRVAKRLCLLQGRRTSTKRVFSLREKLQYS